MWRQPATEDTFTTEALFRLRCLLSPSIAFLSSGSAGLRQPHAAHEVGVENGAKFFCIEVLRLFSNVGAAVVDQNVKLPPRKLLHQSFDASLRRPFVEIT